ncbi:MAG: TetR/AcrR family transcriptional regulator [Acidimicrobiaceae bacterium]|nr:TetR/AcrR family transcriptional regulator [Acidimicrobiaceae bacterium]
MTESSTPPTSTGSPNVSPDPGAGSDGRPRRVRRPVPERAGALTPSTSERILDAALTSFGERGYEPTSLDALAVGLKVRKQTILYWYPSKEALLDAVIDRSAAELSAALEASLASAGTGWARVEAVVRSVFRLAVRRPELLGLAREMGRLGAPAATRFIGALEPLVERAANFLGSEMDAGHMRRHEPRLLLLAIYSSVIGMITEVDVLRAMGEEPTARSLVKRRTEILEFLRSALVTDTG